MKDTAETFSVKGKKRMSTETGNEASRLKMKIQSTDMGKVLSDRTS